jgi:hypothetical protein
VRPGARGREDEEDERRRHAPRHQPINHVPHHRAKRHPRHAHQSKQPNHQCAIVIRIPAEEEGQRDPEVGEGGCGGEVDERALDEHGFGVGEVGHTFFVDTVNSFFDFDFLREKRREKNC